VSSAEKTVNQHAEVALVVDQALRSWSRTSRSSTTTTTRR